MGILRLLAWWLGGERPLRTRPPHPVGTITRPWATSTVYQVTRRVTGPAGIWGRGRATGVYKGRQAAHEYAQTVLARRPLPRRPLPRSSAWWLLRQMQRRFGLAEAAAAAAIAAAFHADLAN